MAVMKKLVSIILPCYNGGSTLKRALDSILEQTYPYIELVFVDDGSTDNTHDIAEHYCEAFQRKGYRFLYIFQENRGLGGAVDTGLKHFTGDYLCWQDADDALLPDAVEKKVRFLDSHPEFGCADSDAYMVSDEIPEKVLGKISDGIQDLSNPNQFENMLYGKTIFCAGCHIIRSEVFLKANPTRSIYPARHGQNWQLLLPVYYHSHRGYLDEPLYKYYIQNNSMSAQINSADFPSRLAREKEYCDIVRNTLMHIPEMPKTKKYKYFWRYQKSYRKKVFWLLLQFQHKVHALLYLGILFLTGSLDKQLIKQLLDLILK